MTNYQSLCNLWTSIGFYLRDKISFICFVLLKKIFHEIHAQHSFMVIGLNLNICDKWAGLISCPGGYSEVFLESSSYFYYNKGVKYGALKVL